MTKAASDEELVDAIAEFVDDASSELIDRVAASLDQQRGLAGVVAANLAAAGRLKRLVTAASNAGVHDTALALALRAAKASDHRASRQKVDVVWTGPGTRAVPTRRTRQLLEELIRRAESDAWIVSYHVLGARSVLDAVLDRAKAGVRVRILIETIKDGERTLDHVKALGHDLAGACELYEWPMSHRLEFSDGSPWVSLHAKATVCDGRELFVTSANMTSRALDRNMELGLHVCGGEAPHRVTEHFDSLVANGALAQLHYAS